MKNVCFLALMSGPDLRPGKDVWTDEIFGRARTGQAGLRARNDRVTSQGKKIHNFFNWPPFWFQWGYRFIIEQLCHGPCFKFFWLSSDIENRNCFISVVSASMRFEPGSADWQADWQAGKISLTLWGWPRKFIRLTQSK